MRAPPFQIYPPHLLSPEEAKLQLQTQGEGLTLHEAKERLTLFGKNELEEEEISYVKLLLSQFNSSLIYVLVAASLISLIMKEWVDFLVITGIVLLNSLIGFWQEVKAHESIQALKKMTQTRVRVIRSGKEHSIPSSDLVPGDLVEVREGEVVAADLRLLSASSLLTDESSITGESLPVSKDPGVVLPPETPPYDWKNVLIAGTMVVRGEGRAIAVKTGRGSYFASIAEKAKEASPETPLTKALKEFAQRYIGALLSFFSILFLVGLAQGRALAELGYILVASLVSAIPEGLPLVVTLVMVIGAMALSHRKALIRKLASVETLGSATVIATDKTGTVTEGKLRVEEWVGEERPLLEKIAVLCNDAPLEGGGDPLDAALLQQVKKAKEIREAHPRLWSYPFEAKEMLMASVHEIDGEKRLLVKGAYEALKKISPSHPKGEGPFLDLLEKGYRVLALGMGRWEEGQMTPAQWKIEIVGWIGFLDPPKEGVKEAVSEAKKASIHVLMLTGDHPMTARWIAQKVGIWKPGDALLTGGELSTMEDGALRKALKKATVLARILPEHKYRVVKLLQEEGEVVAVSGDGVNDVPALKAADLGIAMGSGTEAAKSASEMVITDNNLKVIVEAVRQGRVIADTIRKVIYFLLATSMQEMCTISLAIFSSLPLPLTAIQILWINLVAGGALDKTFAFMKEEGNVMQRAPKRSRHKFFDARQIGNILYYGLGVGLYVFLQYFLLLKKGEPFADASAITFTSVAMAQWANGIQAQKEREPFFKGIGRSFSINPTLYLGLLIGVALQLFVVYAIPEVFQTRSLSLKEWIYPIGTFLFSFGWVELGKWVERVSRK